VEGHGGAEGLSGGGGRSVVGAVGVGIAAGDIVVPSVRAGMVGGARAAWARSGPGGLQLFLLASARTTVATAGDCAGGAAAVCFLCRTAATHCSLPRNRCRIPWLFVFSAAG
jgi:hypothetical protein